MTFFIYNSYMTQRTNELWLADLRTGGQRQAVALEELRSLILRGLPYALAGTPMPAGISLTALIEDVAQETLLRVLKHLDTFEGRSAFTTWVQKIAVREALAELRHRRWQDAPLPDRDDAEISAPARLLTAPQPTPETIAERNELLRRVEHIIQEELTVKQRQVVLLLAVNNTPVDEAARQLGMKPNALYKLLYDARARLKRGLAAEGLSPSQLLAAFASHTK